jgi:hypothetical protein
VSFKIQMRTDIVRNKNINALEFVLLAKLIQAYYLSGKKDEFELQHKNLIFLLNIGDNNTFKKAYNHLFDQGHILNKIISLPRKNGLPVKINPEIIPELNKDTFTQVTKDVLDKCVIDEIGYVGVRLIYYYQSYINKKEKKDHCYASEDTIADHLGISRRSVINYNNKFKENKLVKIVAHELKETGEYVTKGNELVSVFNKYNNHYFVNEGKIEKFVARNSGYLI